MMWRKIRILSWGIFSKPGRGCLLLPITRNDRILKVDMIPDEQTLIKVKPPWRKFVLCRVYADAASKHRELDR
jgi:hypothetical protein